MKDFDESEALGLNTAERQALQELLSTPELTDQEWDGLRGKVLAACEPQLVRRSRAASRPRRSLLVTWLRPALPLAAAAAALVVLLRPPSDERPREAASDQLTVAEQALLSDVSEAELTRLISGAADAEDLLLMAVTED